MALTRVVVVGYNAAAETDYSVAETGCCSAATDCSVATDYYIADLSNCCFGLCAADFEEPDMACPDCYCFLPHYCD